MSRHSDRFMDRVADIVRTERETVALQLVAGPGVIFESACRSANVAHCFLQGLAAVQRFHHGKQIQVLKDKCGCPLQDARAFNRGRVAPHRIEGSARRGNSLVDILLRPRREPGKRCAGARVETLHGPVMRRLREGPVNKMACRQARPACRCSCTPRSSRLRSPSQCSRELILYVDFASHSGLISTPHPGASVTVAWPSVIV